MQKIYNLSLFITAWLMGDFLICRSFPGELFMTNLGMEKSGNLIYSGLFGISFFILIFIDDDIWEGKKI